MQATAEAHPNIAVVKYWGKRDIPLNLPAVPSLSVTLDRYRTRTTVTWGVDAAADHVELDGAVATGGPASKVSRFLDLVGGRDRPRCRVVSDNNFPTAAGLASSSSGFAALALAACAAARQDRDRRELSVLARQGSGSACRSLWGGWVHWRLGEQADGDDSHGEPLAPSGHWDVCVVVAIVGTARKKVGSTAGMQTTERTCPFYDRWVETAPADVAEGRRAILGRDLERLGRVMEWSTNKMHATMIATEPTLRYWAPASVAAMQRVEALREEGVGAWYTMDAGPNVKVLCLREDAARVADALREVVDQVETLGVGGDARLLD
jgi:diphosphomevalonate decarboxylase